MPNKHWYQGKELEEGLDVELYDFHARLYDPQLGRFWGVDPADQYPSPYTGMGNDYVNGTDPTGMTYTGAYVDPKYGNGINQSDDVNRTSATEEAAVLLEDKITVEHYVDDATQKAAHQANDPAQGERKGKMSKEEFNARLDAALNSNTVVEGMKKYFGFNDEQINSLKSSTELRDKLYLNYDLTTFTTAVDKHMKPAMGEPPLVGTYIILIYIMRLFSGVRAITQLAEVAEKSTLLKGAVSSNYWRFVSKMPANSKAGASFQLLDDENYLFQASSPGRV